MQFLKKDSHCFIMMLLLPWGVKKKSCTVYQFRLVDGADGGGCFFHYPPLSLPLICSAGTDYRWLRVSPPTRMWKISLKRSNRVRQKNSSWADAYLHCISEFAAVRSWQAPAGDWCYSREEAFKKMSFQSQNIRSLMDCPQLPTFISGHRAPSFLLVLVTQCMFHSKASLESHR